MADLAVITGAGSGIGRALARKLATAGHSVMAVGRNREALEATGDGFASFTPLAADLAEPEGRSAVTDAVGNDHVRFVVHNAGRLEPVGDLASLTQNEWRQTLAINVEAPLFLTQALLPQLASGSRVLHISSGAAHRPIRGWGSYCITKAGAYMIYRLLADELAAQGIAVGSLRPGVVDTPMQSYIRGLSPEQFPDVELFRALKDRGELVTPEDVAAFAHRLLVDVDARRFTDGEWDIRDHWDRVY